MAEYGGLILAWLLACVIVAVCWTAYHLGDAASKPRPTIIKPPLEEPKPVPPTHEEKLRKIQREYEQNMALLDVIRDQSVREAGKDRLHQKFIDDMEALL